MFKYYKDNITKFKYMFRTEDMPTIDISNLIEISENEYNNVEDIEDGK